GFRDCARLADRGHLPSFLSGRARRHSDHWSCRVGTVNVAMNEIKFACPHCRQHIACDEGYCGCQIACPACEGAMILPKLAIFGLRAPANLSLALPVATPVPRQAAEALSRTPAAWSEKEWDRHV